MYYLRARYYDPTIGRFISRDSYEGDISNPLSLNSYSYCYNNPLIYVDPTGHYTDYSKIDYASEAARMNISQTGAWKDVVDQRLADIGRNYMGGITDLHVVAAIIQTVSTTTSTSSSVPGGSPSTNGATQPKNTTLVKNQTPVIKTSISLTTQETFVGSSIGTTRYWDNNFPVLLLAGSRFHTDYNLQGQKFIHDMETGYRFNNKGQLVEHSGKAIGEPKGKAAKVLQYIKNIKPGFFTKSLMPIIIMPKQYLDKMIYGDNFNS